MDAMKKEVVYNLGLVYEQMGEGEKSIGGHEADLRGGLRLSRRGAAGGKFLRAQIAGSLGPSVIRSRKTRIILSRRRRGTPSRSKVRNKGGTIRKGVVAKASGKRCLGSVLCDCGEAPPSTRLGMTCARVRTYSAKLKDKRPGACWDVDHRQKKLRIDAGGFLNRNTFPSGNRSASPRTSIDSKSCLLAAE